MNQLTASEVLRDHCIEIAMDDPRSTEQVLLAFVDSGHIELEVGETTPEVPPTLEPTVLIDPTRYRLYQLGVLALTGRETRVLGLTR